MSNVASHLRPNELLILKRFLHHSPGAIVPIDGTELTAEAAATLIADGIAADLPMLEKAAKETMSKYGPHWNVQRAW